MKSIWKSEAVLVPLTALIVCVGGAWAWSSCAKELDVARERHLVKDRCLLVCRNLGMLPTDDAVCTCYAPKIIPTSTTAVPALESKEEE